MSSSLIKSRVIVFVAFIILVIVFFIYRQLLSLCKYDNWLLTTYSKAAVTLYMKPSYLQNIWWSPSSSLQCRTRPQSFGRLEDQLKSPKQTKSTVKRRIHCWVCLLMNWRPIKYKFSPSLGPHLLPSAWQSSDCTTLGHPCEPQFGLH